MSICIYDKVYDKSTKTYRQCKNKKSEESNFCNIHKKFEDVDKESSDLDEEEISRKLEEERDKEEELIQKETEEKEIENIYSFTYLTGPSFLGEYYSKEYNKHICSLGEYHTQKFQCSGYGPTIEFEEYVALILRKNPDVYFDIFIESDILNKEYKTKHSLGSPLQIFKKRFKKCLSFEKKLCNYKNARFHYSDPRTRNVSDSIYESVYLQFHTLQFFKNSDFSSSKKWWNIVSDKYFVTNNKNFHFENLPLKIRKQFFTMDSNIRKIIIDDYNKGIESANITKDEIDKFSEYIKNINGNKINITYIDIEFINLLFLKFCMLTRNVMDIYMLGRIFKKFINKETGEVSEAKNIIIFTGNGHNIHYHDFFNKIGFKSLIHDDNKNNCIKLKHPLFIKILTE